MEHPVPPERLTPAVQKVCGPKAPSPLKAMAAGGMTPLKPHELMTALYVLSYEADPKIGDKARSTLAKMPENVMLGALEKLDDAQIIDGVTRLVAASASVFEKALLNRHTGAETVVWLVSQTDDDRTLELAASNEARLLSHPEIIEALYHNRAARMSTVDRAVELAVRNGIELSGIPSFKEVKAAIEGELIPEPTDQPTPDDLLFTANLEAAALSGIDEESVDAAYEDTGAETPEAIKETVQSAEQSIAQMSISSKIRVATLGNATQRAILVRDSNKLVVLAVLKSPGLNDSEVRRFSRFKTLPDEAVRHIAGSREWTKHYSVKLNLVQNPRCPLEYTLRFLPHIRVPDLRGLSRDKNVPQAVARAAKQLLQKRMK